MTAVDENGSASIMEAASGKDLYIPIVYAVTTGLRRGEVLAQRWSDIDFEATRCLWHSLWKRRRPKALDSKSRKGRSDES